MNNSLDGFRPILLKSFIGRGKARRIRKRTNRYKDYLACSIYFVSKIITRAIITGALSIINGNLLESLAICFRIMILSLESVISNKLSYFALVYASPLVVCSHFSFNRCIHLSNFGIGIEDIFTICNPKISEDAGGIVSILFKRCSFMLARVIWLIFDCSFPDAWKIFLTQYEFGNFVHWCVVNGVSLSYDKCFLMRSSRNRLDTRFG